MAKALNIFKILALIAFSTLCIFLSILVHKATATVSKADSALTELNTTLKEVNKPQVGTVAELTKTLLAIKSTSVHADLILDHENKQLTALDAQERTLYTDLHTTLLAGQNTLNQGSTLLATANQTVLDVQPVITQSQIAIAGATTDLDAIHEVIADPSIPKTLAALQTTSEQTAGTMANVNATTSDVKQAVHSYLHPRWYKTLVNYTLDVVHVFF